MYPEKVVEELLAAADAVCFWDYSDCDKETQDCIDHLQTVVDSIRMWKTVQGWISQ